MYAIGYEKILPLSIKQEKYYRSKHRKSKSSKKYSNYKGKKKQNYRKSKEHLKRKYKKVIKCFKCGKKEHVALDCKIKEIIEDLDIGRSQKRLQMRQVMKDNFF